MDFLFVHPVHTGVFIVLTLGWWGEFWFFPSHRRGGGRDPNFVRILQAILLALALGLGLSAWGWGNLTGPGAAAWGLLSLAVYAAGLGLRYWSLLTLGAWFSRAVETADEQPLVSSGPYRYLRHPSYLGLLLLTVGALLFIRNLPALLVGGALVYAALYRRMVDEESLMERSMGSRYRRWKEQRGRLVPRLPRKNPRRLN